MTAVVDVDASENFVAMDGYVVVGDDYDDSEMNHPFVQDDCCMDGFLEDLHLHLHLLDHNNSFFFLLDRLYHHLHASDHDCLCCYQEMVAYC